MGRTQQRSSAIVGIGCTDWVGDWLRTRAGEKPTDSYGYGAMAFRKAIADAGVRRDEIDGLIVGPSTAYERMGEILGINTRWGGQLNAVQAIMEAGLAIQAGVAEVVALVYGNNQRSGGVRYGGGEDGGAAYLSYAYHAPWGLTSQGALYALTFRAYQHARGVTEAELGEVAVAQRAWASQNSNAIMRKRITIDDYLASQYVCEPLRLLDYCLVNDGGVALIITNSDRAKKMHAKPVFIEAIGRSDINKNTSTLEARLTEFYLPAQQAAAAQSYEAASLGPADMDAFMVYDSFSVHVPLALEGYGYCAVGEAGKFLREKGIGPGGAIPTNTSGGHLSESYMQGWNHQIEAVRQIRGECGDRQISGCQRVHYTSDIAGKCMSIIYSG